VLPQTVVRALRRIGDRERTVGKASLQLVEDVDRVRDALAVDLEHRQSPRPADSLHRGTGPEIDHIMGSTDQTQGHLDLHAGRRDRAEAVPARKLIQDHGNPPVTR
jgi:hypothetical protein